MGISILKRIYLFALVFGFVLNINAQQYFHNANGQATYLPHNVETACTPDSVIFNYTGAAVSFTVPPCVTSITVRAWGGGGGGAGNDTYNGQPGGGGAYASSTIAVVGGQVFSVVVGGGGGLGGSHVASTGAGTAGFGLGNGGPGGDPGPSGSSGAGGGGGGGSGLVSNGAIVFDAAGGGGGGGGGNHSAGGAGGASGQTGTDGVSSSDGSESVGGAAGGSSDTVGTVGANQGGSDGGAGGGGGGGDKAGAGGGAPGCDCGGAGGGGGNSLGTTVTNGSGQTVGNSGYATLPGGTGAGGGAGAAGGVNGGNGYLVISYCVPLTFTLTTTQGNISCYNANNGYGVAHATGAGPFTYSWSTTPVQTNDSATGLSAGVYTVTVGNGGACDQTAVVTITQPNQLRDSIAAFTNVSVACGSNGTATVGVKGGGGTYFYSWNTTPVQTSAMATNLAAGGYTVTVTDNNNCVVTASATIAQPGALTASIAGTTPTACNGAGTGTATGAVSGGTAPYIYSWSNGTTGVKDSLLGPGSYTVSITDANKCTVTAVAVISSPNPIRDSIVKTINVLCNGQTNGQATVGAKGGAGGFTYSWNSTPVQTNATATGLGVGVYTVVVTDVNGCKDSAVATITQPLALEITASPFAAKCNGVCNGSATVIPNIKTGTQPYTYLWSNGSTAANTTALCAGTYSVVVTDANGCTHDTTNLVVTQPAAFAFTKTETAAFCNKADGGATVTITGGTPPYIDGWSNTTPTQTGLTLANVKPGNYCLGVQDALGCQDTVCAIIGNIPGETASITSTIPVTCNGGTNGTATGTATGGTIPYTYSWSTAPAQTNAMASNLSAAAYTLTVKDSAGCVSTAIATVTQPALVVTTIKASPITICYGGTPSALTASSTGGNGVYTYLWSPGTTLNDSTTAVVQASPLGTTTYTVTSADTSKCPATKVTVTVIVDPKLSATTGTPVATCPGGSVTLSATAKGGDGNYTYTWMPGAVAGQNVVVSPTATGYYTVIVSDGCTVPDGVDSMMAIVDPLPVIAFTADTLNGCSPVCDHFTDNTTIASGGIKSWTWKFGDGQTYSSTSASSKVDTGQNCYANPGIYSVTETVVSDSGCSATVTQNNMITVYSHPNVQFTPNPGSTTIEQPGVSFINQSTDAYGITGYLWETFGDNSDSSAISPNAYHTYSDTGTFCVKLVEINKHNCPDSLTKCVVINALYTLYVPNAFTPNADGRDDIFTPVGTYFATFEMYIFNRWGSPIYHTTDITKGWNGSVNNTGPLSQEDTYMYLINVTDFRGTDHSYLGKVTLIK